MYMFKFGICFDQLGSRSRFGCRCGSIQDLSHHSSGVTALEVGGFGKMTLHTDSSHLQSSPRDHGPSVLSCLRRRAIQRVNFRSG